MNWSRSLAQWPYVIGTLVWGYSISCSFSSIPLLRFSGMRAA